MNVYKKRCRVCVDIAMDKFSKGANEIYNLTLDNNPCNPIVIVEDNEEIKDVESDVNSDAQMNQGVEEIGKLKDVESDVCSDVVSDVQMDQGVEQIVKLKDVESDVCSDVQKDGVEEIIKLKDVTKKRSSQDKFTDKFINCDVKFLSSLIKYASVSWKAKCFLNFGNKRNIFGEYSDDFINFNSWKKSYIDVDLKNNYSNSDDQRRKLIREELMNQLSGNVIRIIDNNYSIFMSDQEIRNSVQMGFKKRCYWNFQLSPQ